MESEHRVEQAINSREIHRWCLPDGTLHREDGPAYARYFRDELEVECWMLNGEFGRLDGGPTALSYQPGGTRVETWLVGPLGKYYDYPSNEQNYRHRDDGPAVVGYYDKDSVRSEEWWVDGVRHRIDAPAIQRFGQRGELLREEWFVEGHRPAKPMWEYFDDGTPKRELWLTDESGLHRTDGPAIRDWHASGAPKSVEYFVHGLMSRSDGPAAVEYYDIDGTHADSQPYVEQWRVDNRLHRVDGPAITVWHSDGAVAEHQWWLNGQRRAEEPSIERWPAAGEVRNKPKDPFDMGVLYADESIRLREWHRMQLDLAEMPDDAAFTDSGWLYKASPSELEDRLCYFANGDAIAATVLDWRERSESPSDSPEAVTRAFAQFLQAHIGDDHMRDSFERGISGPVTIVSNTPERGVDEYRLIDALDFVHEELSVPYILNETIYNASGNHFLPIYWITQPIHGVEMTAWVDFFYARLAAVIGPSGIRIGPRDF